MAKGTRRNITNKNQGNIAASEPNAPLAACPGYTNTPEKQDMDLKSLVMMLLQDHMKDINKSLKEIQEKMDQKLEALTRETQKIIERNSGKYRSKDRNQ